MITCVRIAGLQPCCRKWVWIKQVLMRKAVEQYEIFLDIWKNADEYLKSVVDAKERLVRLKNKT